MDVLHPSKKKKREGRKRLTGVTLIYKLGNRMRLE